MVKFLRVEPLAPASRKTESVATYHAGAVDDHVLTSPVDRNVLLNIDEGGLWADGPGDRETDSDRTRGEAALVDCSPQSADIRASRGSIIRHT